MTLHKWLPRETQPVIKSGVQNSRDGEPTRIPLTRWRNDRTLRGQLWNGCCDCGLEHLLTFEVMYDGRDFYLTKRSYRGEKKPMKKPKKRRGGY